MSIELLTDATAGVVRPRAAEPGSETSAAKRSSQKEQDAVESSRVTLDATKEMDELVKLVRQAPTEPSQARLDQLAMQVKNGEYSPNLQRTAEAILEELDMLPDPPHDTLP